MTIDNAAKNGGERCGDVCERGDLFASKYDSAYQEWISLKPPSYKNLLNDDTIADPFRVRALRDLIDQDYKFELKEVPEQFQQLAIDLIFEKAKQKSHLLLQIIEFFPEHAERAVDDLLHSTPNDLLGQYILYCDQIPLYLKRRIDRRLRQMVLQDIQRENKYSDAWKDRSRWHYYNDDYQSALYTYVNIAVGCLCSSRPCDMTLRREQVYFLAARDAQVFWRYDTYDMLRNHFSGSEDTVLRKHIFHLIARESNNKEWILHNREWCTEWMNDIADDSFTLQAVEAALLRGKALEEENRVWQMKEDARQTRILAALRK